MRIALLGTRGIPASYGGFETFAEQLSTRLAARGHEVFVYCRNRLPQSEYRGVDLRYLPAIRHKYLETIAHTGLSTLHEGSGTGLPRAGIGFRNGWPRFVPPPSSPTPAPSKTTIASAMASRAYSSRMEPMRAESRMRAW